MTAPLTRYHPLAETARAAFHPDVTDEVATAVARDHVVVVGMAGNPFVRRARTLLTEAGIPFTYLEYGSYISQWKPRLAIKMWSGWPTFPQVFVDGALVGGFTELRKLHAEGGVTRPG